MMLFEPLDFAHGHTRIDRHRAARLAMLRGRIVKKMAKIDHAADEVERAADRLIEATAADRTRQPVANRKGTDTAGRAFICL